MAALAVGVGVGLSASGTPADASFPGLNGRIACGGVKGPVGNPNRNEIFTVNPDGTGETVLSNNATTERVPAFSPDGTKIAFLRVTANPTNADIYVANNDGDLGGPDEVRLTTNLADDTQPTWSPDGTQIAFHSFRPATFPTGTSPRADFEIYRMSSTTGEAGGLTRLTNDPGQDAIPSWSPDGTTIAFQSAAPAGGSFFNLEVFTMNATDGSALTNISNNPGTPDNAATTGREDSDATDRDASWSPDSTKLVYSSTRDNKIPGNQNYEIFKINRDGSNRQRLTLNASGDTPFPAPFFDYDATPTWSPDGKRILFLSGRNSTPSGDTNEIFTMDAAVGEIGGVQRVASTGGEPDFNRCDWQSLRAPTATPTPTPTPTSPYYNIPTPTAIPTVTPTPPPGTTKKKPRLTAKARPKRDKRKPFVFKVSGQLKLPSGVSRSAGCKGTVVITGKKGSKTIAKRRSGIKSTCKYKARVKLRKNAGRRGKVKFQVKYLGSNVLKTASAKTSAKYGR